MPNQQERARYVRNGQLARYLNVSPMTVFRWQRDKSLNFPKPSIINGNSFTDLDAVDAWMKDRVVTKAKPDRKSTAA
jgi:predicted DNA-binding transcriptional regulator AlpA